MNNPDAHELLMTARDVLMSRVFPLVPEDLHYEIRMIASAMGIAAREARDGHRTDRLEQDFLSGVIDEDSSGKNLSDLRASVAGAIRDGLFVESEEQRHCLERILLETTLNALEINNPKVARKWRERQ
ncbi:DUF6285 domain-containing protein [Marinobacter sp. F3R08]|uniref:DUF6285 domain-containing protein n=1 Tax=Marinobacter sp. F3R08 TaxID=2841559 RepID=UPI001C09FD63|nr:DUF6285 domain-containing protein [Marinobacter sp. F3R08]MBU2952914.1 hypothetical protein [Marinobacter sp. F3R08]